MPVCSYLIVPEPGAGKDLAHRLDARPECDVALAEGREALLLVTDTPDAERDRALRHAIEAEPGIHAMVLTFGEIDPETPEADPVEAGRPRRKRRLPVVGPADLDRVVSTGSDPGARLSPRAPPGHE